LLSPDLGYLLRDGLRRLAYHLHAQAEYVFGPLLAPFLLTSLETQLREAREAIAGGFF
jgi:hypothetical protein